jgi:long-subunit fatty acid transport protein
VNYTKWSVYNKLIIDLDKQLPAAQIIQNKDWENTMTFRLGSSFDLNDLTVLRGGILFDQAPVPDETIDAQLPDNDRIGISVGFGRKIGRINLDLSYLFLKFSDRDKENFVGYQDVTDSFPPIKTPTVKDGIINAADQQMLGAMRGGIPYPVGSGTYKSHVNLLSVSASIKF